jgi:hypothetical protein
MVGARKHSDEPSDFIAETSIHEICVLVSSLVSSMYLISSFRTYLDIGLIIGSLISPYVRAALQCCRFYNRAAWPKCAHSGTAPLSRFGMPFGA